jgi:Uncharacterized conserved protein
MKKETLMRTLYIALFAALIAVGSYIKILVIPPVPISLQTLFMVLLGLVLPPTMALSSMLIYLFIGMIGLPVFTSGGGIAALLGPTGGYLIGGIPAVVAGALIMKANKKNAIWLTAIAGLVETMLIYAVGLPWLSVKAGLTLSKTLAGGLYPFLVGDTLKLIVAVAVAKATRAKITASIEKAAEDEE